MALAGFAFSKLNIVQRVLMGIGSLALLWPDPIMDVIGLALFAAMVLWNWFQNRSEKKATVG